MNPVSQEGQVLTSDNGRREESIVSFCNLAEYEGYIDIENELPEALIRVADMIADAVQA